MGGRIPVMYGSPSRFVHTSNLRTTTVVTDQTGAELEDELFYPWGQDWTRAGLPYALHFAGMHLLQDAGLYPTPNRDYTPSLGRWMTPDPPGGDVTNPQSLNRYAYVLNSPTTLTDPLELYNPFECDPLDPIDCGPPSCYFGHPGDCPPCDPVFGCPPPPPGGGGRGGSSGGAGGGVPPSAPPAGQPPLGGAESFNGPLPCIDPISEIPGIALAAGGALGTTISPGNVRQASPPVGTGGENEFNVNQMTVDVGQIANATSAQADPFHPQWQISITEPKNIVPSPGRVIHLLFDVKPGPGPAQATIYNVTAHVDIFSPVNNAQKPSLWGGAGHGVVDVGFFTAIEFLSGRRCGYKFD